jgi:hypothetical protein
MARSTCRHHSVAYDVLRPHTRVGVQFGHTNESLIRSRKWSMMPLETTVASDLRKMPRIARRPLGSHANPTDLDSRVVNQLPGRYGWRRIYPGRGLNRANSIGPSYPVGRTA